jgi:hypothetical protein
LLIGQFDFKQIVVICRPTERAARNAERSH